MAVSLTNGDPGTQTWVHLLPDGAVSVETQDRHLVLRASGRLQRRFEKLLEKRKLGELTATENREHEAICRLDDTLSWLNRLARRTPSGS
jgi:hypothetical protein